jgi:hypothetical protein
VAYHKLIVALDDDLSAKVAKPDMSVFEVWTALSNEFQPSDFTNLHLLEASLHSAAIAEKEKFSVLLHAFVLLH